MSTSRPDAESAIDLQTDPRRADAGRMIETPGILPLFAALALAWLGFLTCFAETRAVRAWRMWPFRHGFVAVRFRAPSATGFQPGRVAIAQGIEYRVLSATECVFVEKGWRSAVSWTSDTSPFRLKGHASWSPSGIEVVGRISLGVSLALPGVSLWLGGCGLVGLLSPDPWFFAIFVAVGFGTPILGTWYSLPREIAAFRSDWTAVAEDLLAQPPSDYAGSWAGSLPSEARLRQ